MREHQARHHAFNLSNHVGGQHAQLPHTALGLAHRLGRDLLDPVGFQRVGLGRNRAGFDLNHGTAVASDQQPVALLA
ncbi:hypothetical protein JHN55_21790 [Streptomyces sp. MBT56]|uniref:hypothetical protein n=1 Tax=unclassified Streptomyces TaxID=2593676 RepID=UPI00190A7E69|nr:MULTISPECIES: hypothetical protein [unclassified Streptomyces]MBK3559104.1 hypothetical protein [Streptomyces sp. MBT56]MBK3600384.1 hypothetical protein [Streptomyces sp. MBT54]MBK3614593.1 hypothetical protein [Streptomyces sp. MBT98]